MTGLSIPARARRFSAQMTGEPKLSAMQVYEVLRGEILSLALAPGSSIHRADLQDRFGLSSTPVRDALIRLSEEGLVEIIPQSATRVSLIDIIKAREAQFLRRALEIEAVETLSLSPDKAVLPLLRTLVAEQRMAANASDPLAFDGYDGEFHRLIFEAAGVIDLFHLIRQRNGHIDRIRRLNLPVAGKMQEVVSDHEQILQAIVESAPANARLAMRDHLSRSLAYTPELMARYPRFFRPMI